MVAFLLAVALFLIGAYVIIKFIGAIIGSTLFFGIVAFLIIRSAIRK